MGIEEDMNLLKTQLFQIHLFITKLDNKLDLLLSKEQPKDRQDKEKKIKDTLVG